MNPYPARHNVVPPAIPFTGDIPNGVSVGKQIVVHGAVNANAQQFRVDLLTVNGHTAIHINPRFNVKQTVRNTDRNGWGAEERQGVFAFNQGAPFQMTITADNDRFRVAVNEQPNFDYVYRVPINEINRISVQGDVRVNEINFEGGSSPVINEVRNLPSPSAVPILGGVRKGKLIQVTGLVPQNAGRFQINLQQGPQPEPNNINLHFNPRWNDPYSSTPVTVRTHRHNGGWGQEDRNQPPFPFQQGARFDLFILCDEGQWRIGVNGQHYVGYAHPFDVSTVDHIGFVGDVVIESVRQFA